MVETSTMLNLNYNSPMLEFANQYCLPEGYITSDITFNK